MKTCSKCKKEKEVGDFYKNKRNVDGLQIWCRGCKKDYILKNKEKIAAYCKEYRSNHKEQMAQYKKEFRERNKEKLVVYMKDYQIKNRDHIVTKKKEYRLNNKEHLATKRNVYVKNRIKTDIQFRLSYLLRSRLCKAVKSNQKSGSAIQDLGCTIPELKSHLEGQFQDGMTWKNHSRVGWHIDHKIPLDFYDLTNREQFLLAVHYTNLQPMWAIENLKKGNKIIV